MKGTAKMEDLRRSHNTETQVLDHPFNILSFEI
jgi:hypothetical protein